MPISIYQIENLFWSNETYEFPAHLPTIFVDKEEDLPLRPEMDGYFSGTIRLIGSNWNWCKFENVYYQLKRTTCLNADPDPKKEVWLYTLVRCMWTNTVLTNTVEIKGDLATWNTDDLLSVEINKCSWMIEKPVEIFRTPFIEENPEQWKFTLTQNSEKFKKISWESRDKVLTHNSLISLKAKIKWLAGFKEATKYLYYARKDVYIFGLIEGVVYKDSWKNKVIKRINEAHDDIKLDNRRIFVKVTTPQNHNKLLNHYALSYSDSSIGQIDNSMVLRTLDLSNVTNIVPINWKDLQEKPKETLINENTAVFHIIGDLSTTTGWDKPWKLARRFYSPLGNPSYGSYYYDGYTSRFPNASRKVKYWRNVDGQKVIFKDFWSPNYTRTAFFYWLDRMDFTLGWYDSNIYAGGLYAKYDYSLPQWYWNLPGYKRESIYKNHPVFIYLENPFNLSYWSAGSNAGWYISKWSPYAFPYHTIDGFNNKDGIINRIRRTPGYGVILWQTERDWNYWDRVKYIGPEPVEKLYWYSGIHLDKFRDTYQRNDKWWSYIKYTQLARLCNDEMISKFFLDLDFFSWVNFTPKVCCDDGTSYYQSPHFYYDNFDLAKFLEGGIGDYDGNTIASGVRKIINKANNSKITPPFTDTTYPSYSFERTRKIGEVLLKSELDLKNEFKKNYTIEPGDFFCSDLEYEWREWNNSIWSTEENFYKGLKDDTFTRTANTLEDFIQPCSLFSHGSRLENEKSLRDGEGICLCSNLEGGIEIRRINWFKKEHSLAKADYQAVISVDGVTEKTITYWLLKGLGINLDTEIGSDIGISSTNKLLAYFYKALGYDVDIEKRGSDFIGKWNWITDEMLTSPEGVLFDLVGSDWYAYLRNKDEVHFIYKHADPTKKGDITPKSVKRSILDRSSIDEKLKNASLTAKINQINILYFHNKPIHIKTKFLFNPTGFKDSPFYVEYDGFNTKDKFVNEEFWNFRAKGEWDEIDEIISIPKKAVDITQVPDQLNLEQLRLNQNYEQERYEHQQQFVGLEQKLIDIHAERAEFDLNTEDINRSLGNALDIAGLTGSMAMRAYSPMANTLMKSIPRAEFKLGRKYSVGKAYNVKPSDHVGRWNTAKGIRNFGRFMRKVGLGPTMGILDAAGELASHAIWKNRVLPEKSRRIQEDKELASKQIALKTLEIDRSHFHAMQDYALRINYLANQHFKEGFNEHNLFQEWKTMKKINSNVYLLTLIPSKKQLKYISEYREHYGVQCDIPNKVITLKNGMAPNVIRFRNLDEGAILGISDLVARAWLKARLLSQVKIVDNERPKSVYSYFDYHVTTPVVIDDITKCNDIIQTLEKELEELKNDLARSHKTSQLNLNAFLTKLDKDRNDETLLQSDIDNLNEIKKKIEAAITQWEEDKKEKPELEKPYEDQDIELVNKFIKAFEDVLEAVRQRKQLEADKEKAENERDKLKEDLKQAEKIENSLINENDALHKNLEQTQKTLDSTKNEKEKLKKKLDSTEDERDTLREQLTKAHEKERNLMNKNDDCGKKIKEYEGYLASFSDLNKSWYDLAKQLDVPTSEAPLDPNRPLDNIEEIKKLQTSLLSGDKQLKLQKDALQKKLEATKAELETTKTELQKAQTEAGKCKAAARRDSTSLTRQIRGWTYCDLLRTFQSLNWNYMEIYKILTNTELYGFSCDEYWNLVGIPTLQAIQQTVEECEDLLANNVHFMHQDSEALRNFLLTEEGADKIRGMKRWFVANWAKMWSYRTTHNETIDRSTWQIKKSTFYDANISFDYPTKEQQIRGANNFMWYNTNFNNAEYAESPISLLVTANNNWNNGNNTDYLYRRKIKTISIFKDSFARAKSWWVVRSYYRVDNPINNWNNETLLIYKYRRLENTSSDLEVFLFMVFRAFEHNFTNKFFYEKISKRILTGSDFGRNAKLQKLGSNVNRYGVNWEYEGFSNRRFFWGYLLVFTDFLYECYTSSRKFDGKSFSLGREGFTMIKKLEFSSLSMVKYWINKLGMQISEWEKFVLYPMKIAYEALCNRLPFEEAQDKIEKELEATKQNN